MNTMSFEEFKKEIKDRILDFLPDDYVEAEVSFCDVKKVNDINMTGLTVLRKGCNIAPSIYLDKYYELYKNGESIENILGDLANIRVESEASSEVSLDKLVDFEACKDRVLPRLYGLELNFESMEERPYTLLDDFVVFYVISIEERVDGIVNIPVNNRMLDQWGINVNELHMKALENFKKNNEGTFKSMSEIMKEMLLPSLLEDMDGNEEMAKELFEEMFGSSNSCQMFVLSNTNNINGATMLLDSEFMESIKERIGEDYYIIPSSIHEVIVVPDSVVENPNDLASMVYEINRAQVSVSDRLSDHIYRFVPTVGYVRAA